MATKMLLPKFYIRRRRELNCNLYFYLPRSYSIVL